MRAKKVKRATGVTVADLKPGQAYGFLYCQCCGQECSADERDYSWHLPADHVFMCCDEPMILARKECRIVEVTP